MADRPFSIREVPGSKPGFSILASRGAELRLLPHSQMLFYNYMYKILNTFNKHITFTETYSGHVVLVKLILRYLVYSTAAAVHRHRCRCHLCRWHLGRWHLGRSAIRIQTARIRLSPRLPRRRDGHDACLPPDHRACRPHARSCQAGRHRAGGCRPRPRQRSRKARWLWARRHQSRRRQWRWHLGRWHLRGWRGVLTFAD